MESTRERLERVLAEFERRADVSASAVVSVEGLLLASELPRSVDENAVAAVCPVISNAGSRASDILQIGDVETHTLIGKTGQVVLKKIGRYIFVALTARGANLGLILFEMDKTLKMIDKIVSEKFPAEEIIMEAAKEEAKRIKETEFFKSITKQLQKEGGKE